MSKISSSVTGSVVEACSHVPYDSARDEYMSLSMCAKMRLKLRLSKPPLDDVTALPDILFLAFGLLPRKGYLILFRACFGSAFYAPMQRQQAKTKINDITM